MEKSRLQFCFHSVPYDILNREVSVTELIKELESKATEAILVGHQRLEGLVAGNINKDYREPLSEYKISDVRLNFEVNNHYDYINDDLDPLLEGLWQSLHLVSWLRIYPNYLHPCQHMLLQEQH